ncbi:GNAT family N-acetyltransferase [Peijinzhouia sedimentorum]|tara:strand:- start:2504 stop:2932 length:429 start_codon:yes stop_codon:yes gene_type:complete
METIIIDPKDGRHAVYTDDKIVNFLFVHLDEFGDKKEDIQKCLDYVHTRGGFIVLGVIDGEIKGAVVINETGMSGYIPENILVYIAMHQDQRGKGLGKKLMQAAIAKAKGNIALHVEPNNPAKFLYEKLGFTSKYLEMRLNR